jgi:hypothetical protein
MMHCVRLGFSFAVVVVVAACADVTAPPRIFVSRVPSGVHSAREEGDALTLTRWELDPRVGLSRGYWIIKSERAWRELWVAVDAERIPLLPPGIDFGTEMLVVAAPTEGSATGARIHQVIDTPEAGVHIYVSQIVPGLGCPANEATGRDGKVPVDLARVRSRDKEIHFHVDTKNEEPCAPPSEAKVGCKIDGTPDPYQERLSVEPGKSIACRSEGKLGSRAMIDRTWSFRALPAGTTTKMTIGDGARGITFGTDAFGTYAIGLEVTDDLGRTSRGTTDVEVTPPKDALVVQMLWTKFQPEDDPSTFPRVELHLLGDKPPPPPLPGHVLPPMAARSQPWILVHGDCTLENTKPPAWCHARTLSNTTIAEVSTDAFPLYRIGVHYSDDRYAGQPVLCVRTFRGALAGEWCDDKIRSEGNWWDVGRVDAITGKVPVPPAPPRPPRPPRRLRRRPRLRRRRRPRLRPRPRLRLRPRLRPHRQSRPLLRARRRPLLRRPPPRKRSPPPPQSRRAPRIRGRLELTRSR